MAQIFHPSTNTLSRVTIFGGVFFLVLLAWGLVVLNRSSYVTLAHVAREQPVPFSHRHHAGQLGIDCRYCHTSVEVGPRAGIPPAQTCMNCHSQIWADSEMLAPVRASFRSGRPIPWVKVHDLPDFVYFDHSIHVHKGIGCTTCHGPIDRMDLTWQAASLQMEWCLDCHRHPERYIRPRADVFRTDWTPPPDQEARGRALLAKYGVRTRILTDCSTCHR